MGDSCSNCKHAEVRTKIGAVAVDWSCKWRPGKRLTRHTLACLQWKPRATCSMTVEATAKHKLTDKQVNAFCKDGCSVRCPELLKDYVAKRKPKEARE